MNLSIADTPLREDLHDTFHDAHPFPLVVLDNVLPYDVAKQLQDEISKQQDFTRSNDYIFARNKFESPRIEEFGVAGCALRNLLLSREMASALSRMYGRPLFIDPDFVGGGLHRGGEASFLDMHVDFNLHPREKRWIRELNILLYLNKDWRPEYGGSLELRNSKTGVTAAIEPLFNRMVIMLTKDHTYHGYKTIRFPAGSFRTSIAAYAYSMAGEHDDLTKLRTTTTWAPNDGNRLKALVARVTPGLVSFKQALFGSATARKRDK